MPKGYESLKYTEIVDIWLPPTNLLNTLDLENVFKMNMNLYKILLLDLKNTTFCSFTGDALNKILK